MRKTKTHSALRVLAVFFLTLAVTVCYSVTPFVSQAYAAAPKAKSITLKTTAKTVDIKGKVTVSVKSVKPAKASKAVTWKSSNKKIATVSSKGVVTGKRKGKVKITATSKSNKKVKKTITITVKNIKPSKVKLNKTKATLNKGKTLTLKATVSPKGVYAPISWKSSNTKVAKVSKAGKVTAVGAGTAKITVATTKKSGIVVKATCTVTVKDSSATPDTPDTPDEPDNPSVVLGETKTRTMTTNIDMSKYDAGKVVKVWVPVPQSDEYQEISDVFFKAPGADKAEITTEEANGNKMLYLEWGADANPADRKASLTFTAKRYDVSMPEVKEDASKAIPDDVKAYIDKESEYVKVNHPVVKGTADKIVEGKNGTIEKARAIYEWVFTNLERIDDGETLTLADGTTHTYVVDGCGYGDTVKILSDLDEFGRAGGHCTDLNSTFVALCRAAGIPAREMFGIRMNDDATGGQHCWAEFYVPGAGWVYADPGDALKALKSKKGMTIDEVKDAKASADGKAALEKFWAHVDNNRVVLSRGRDITFNPPQAWGVCNTFGYPAAEVDGKRLETSFADAKNFVYTIKSEDRTVFVDPAYVKAAAGQENTVIAEVSWGTKAPAEAIPGAIHINTDDLESNAQDLGYELWDLRAFEQLKAVFEKEGITQDTHLICYGAKGSASTGTRLAVTAMMMGVTDVKVLDGGFKAWTDAGNETAPISDPTPVADFGRTEPLHPEWIIDSDQVVEKVENDPNFKLVSIRSYAEFIGDTSGYGYIDKAGEPKGAIWGRNTDDGTYFIDGKTIGIDKMNEYLADYGASTDNELAFYCGTGWRATIPFLICYQAGIDDMKLFDDGWYVYSGAYADEWNWVDGDPSDKKPVKDYPVQIGDPKKGDVEYTTVSKLEANRPSIGKLAANKAEVVAGSTGKMKSNFAIQPGKPYAVSFKSSDEELATVDADGVVTVNKLDPEKTVEITATTIPVFGATPDKAGEPKTASYTIKFALPKIITAAELTKAGVYTDTYKILDLRAADDYAAGHIPGAVSADVSGAVSGADAAAAKKNVEAAIKDDADGTQYVLICYTGNKYANAGREILLDLGKDNDNILILGTDEGVQGSTGGMKAWKGALVNSKDNTVIVKGVVNDTLHMTTVDDITHHVVVNKAGSNAKNALLTTDAQPGEVYKALEEIGAVPGNGFNGKCDAGSIVEGAPVNVNFAWADGTATMSDFFKLAEMEDGAVKVDESGNPVTTDYVADMRFGGCKANLDAFEGDTNQTGCITCTFSCWIGTVSNAAYGYSTNEAFVNRANVPAPGTEVTVVYSLGEEPPAPVEPKVITAAELTKAGVYTDTYKILDLRAADDYAAGHIPGAVSADVSGAVSGTDAAAAAAAKKNVEAAINGDLDGTQYVLICYTGNKYANAGREILLDLGKDNDNILILGTDEGVQGATGGMKAWKGALVNSKDNTVIVKGVVNDTLHMTDVDDITHHVVVNKDGSNAKNALLTTDAQPGEVYKALEEIGAVPGNGFNGKCDAGSIVEGAPVNVNFAWADGTATMSDFFKLAEMEEGIDGKLYVKVDESGNPVTTDYVADMRFGGCKANLDAFEGDTNQTGCITCTFSCWIGTVSNAAYGYSTNEAFVNRANVPAPGTEVTVVYSLGN